MLGSLLWNFGYDKMLWGALPSGLSVTYYANDILVLIVEARLSGDLAMTDTTLFIRKIKELGLRVVLDKTEAVWFYGPRRRPSAHLSHLLINGTHVEVKTKMKCLGLILDSRWDFKSHFGRVTPKAMAMANNRTRLLPKLGSPGSGSRRFFEGVMWSTNLVRRPDGEQEELILVWKTQRIGIRVSRKYRTIVFEVACVLGKPPWEITAEVYVATYKWRTGLRSRGVRPTPAMAARRKFQGRRFVFHKWRERLANATAGLRIVGAVQSVLEE